MCRISNIQYETNFTTVVNCSSLPVYADVQCESNTKDIYRKGLHRSVKSLQRQETSTRLNQTQFKHFISNTSFWVKHNNIKVIKIVFHEFMYWNLLLIDVLVTFQSVLLHSAECVVRKRLLCVLKLTRTSVRGRGHLQDKPCCQPWSKSKTLSLDSVSQLNIVYLF